MEFGKIILRGGEQVFRWLAERWIALVAPAETTAKKRVEVASQLLESRHRDIEWKIEQYEKLGLTKEEIRNLVLPKMKKGEDPLSVLEKLAIEKVIRDIQALDDADEDQEKPPTIDGQ